MFHRFDKAAHAEPWELEKYHDVPTLARRAPESYD